MAKTVKKAACKGLPRDATPEQLATAHRAKMNAKAERRAKWHREHKRIGVYVPVHARLREIARNARRASC